jgi:hypothetical protein
MNNFKLAWFEVVTSSGQKFILDAESEKKRAELAELAGHKVTPLYYLIDNEGKNDA